jgi:hypothetical protein
MFGNQSGGDSQKMDQSGGFNMGFGDQKGLNMSLLNNNQMSGLGDLNLGSFPNMFEQTGEFPGMQNSNFSNDGSKSLFENNNNMLNQFQQAQMLSSMFPSFLMNEGSGLMGQMGGNDFQMFQGGPNAFQPMFMGKPDISKERNEHPEDKGRMIFQNQPNSQDKGDMPPNSKSNDSFPSVQCQDFYGNPFLNKK